MSWADPGNREPEREILESSPGWWPRTLARAERLLRLDRLDRLGRFARLGRSGPLGGSGEPGASRRLGWVRRRPGWVAALGGVALLGATVGVVVTQQQHATAARPPGTRIGTLLPPGEASAQQVIASISASGHVVIVRSGTGAVTVPEGCAQLVQESATGHRTVLGDVLVPSAQLNMLPNGDGVWRYWQHATFLVIGGSPPVTMSVPQDYQDRVALDLEVGGIGSTFHVHACPNHRDWTVATAGFYLKAPAACVPLDVQVGTKSAIVWFALGERCPSGKA